MVQILENPPTIDFMYGYLSKDFLLDKIENETGNFVNDNTLRVYIKRIREKLESEDRFFGFISFNKKQWTLILNDLMILYPDIEFI